MTTLLPNSSYDEKYAAAYLDYMAQELAASAAKEHEEVSRCKLSRKMRKQRTIRWLKTVYGTFNLSVFYYSILVDGKILVSKQRNAQALIDML